MESKSASGSQPKPLAKSVRVPPYKPRFSLLDRVAIFIFFPFVAVFLLYRYIKFVGTQKRAKQINSKLLENAKPVALPEVERFELTPIVEMVSASKEVCIRRTQLFASYVSRSR